MSRENVEIIRRGYEAFAKGRIAFELLDPEIEWRGPREFPDLAETRYGHKGMRRYIAQLNEVFNDYRMVAEEFIDLGGDQVLVFAREGGHGTGSGIEVQTNPTGHLWTFRDGKAIRMNSYWERSDALAAAGLSE
jgi:ketosteroid isomerase-like protein